jgi:hypothetical protein
LVIVPAAFTLVDDIERWIGPKVARAIAARPTKTTVVKPHTAG